MSSPAIVLLILFILVVAASLLLYYLRRRLRRSQPVRHSANAPVQLQHSQSRRRQVSPAPSSSGLLLLPRFKFSDLKRPGSVTVGGDCAICLADFEPEDQLRLLPLCLHAFHVDCIDTWLAGESLICPVCRAEVFRSDSDLLLQTASSAGGSFRLAIGNVSRGRRQDNSSSRTHSIRGGEFEYVVDEEWELQLRDAVHDVEGEDGEIVAVVIDSQPPPSTVEYQSSCGMIFTGSSRRWTELSEGLETIYRWLS